MCLNVLAGELEPVWTLAEPDFHGFSFRVFDLPAVSQDSPDHPEGADANRRRAVNKRGTVFRIVSDLEKLGDLFFVGITVSDGDVEVAQAELFRFRLFVRSAMFAGLPQVDDCLDALGFQLLEVFEFRLTAG